MSHPSRRLISSRPLTRSLTAIRAILTFKWKLTSGLAAATAILLVVAFMSYSSLVQSAEDRQRVLHTYQVIGKLDEVRIGMTDAETGERGYILTGEDSYLEPYLHGLSAVNRSIEQVRKLTADNANQQHALDRLEPIIAMRLSELRERVEVRRKQGLTAGITAVREGAGREYMDQIRAAVASMKSEEERLLTRRSAELTASSQRTRTILVLGELLGLMFLGIAGAITHREMVQRRKAEEEVRKVNADLERKVAERTAELAERAKDLERSNMELEQFAYVASHDLQEPLRTIASFTQLLAKRYADKLDDKAREFIGFAVDGSKRMQTLINDLLSFSRVGTQAKALTAVRCDAVLDTVLRNLNRAVEESGAVITRDALPLVLADEPQLGQLLQNLVGNAIKFRGDKRPQIHIGAERNGKGWKICVRDNGIGIAPEHYERIFIIFQRLHTKTQYAGTGIGLAICKKIVERHGGRLWIDPTPGGGSTFSFTIADGESFESKERANDKLRIGASTN
jgi:signal transduction histidine kinase